MTRLGGFPTLVLALVLLMAPASGTAQSAPTPGAQLRATPAPEEVLALLERPGAQAEAVSALVQLAASLPAAEATLWIQLLSVTQQGNPEAISVGVEGVRTALVRGDPQGAAAAMERGLGAVEREHHPGLLALASILLQDRDPRRAAEFRGRIISQHAGAPEAPEASFHLARWLHNSGTDRERAMVLLETFIVEGAAHPMAPEARRLLQEWRSGGGV